MSLPTEANSLHCVWMIDSMSCNRQKVSDLRRQIPSFECVPDCHDCCGPVTTSPEEMSRLPRKTAAEQEAALDELNCVHLGPQGCTVYDERPLICRLFGTTASLPCPNNRRPVELIHPQVEKQIHAYMASTRQVLV
ncbi:hypothetical protein ALP45_03561 [Pseudomonas coronafaciens pv. atropurpurea]|nr:Uncharacterized protein family [Pseudomonas coronafaciens pv. atropurpurea]RMT62970.1 hypothetical protein ALP45_03561 [Pseudomonas coronafaciens pv. atropurpurea]